MTKPVDHLLAPVFPAPKDYVSVGLHTRIQVSFSPMSEKISKTISKSSHNGVFPASFCTFKQFKSSPKSNSRKAKCFQATTEANGVGECSAPFRICSFYAHMNENLWFSHSCI